MEVFENACCIVASRFVPGSVLPMKKLISSRSSVDHFLQRKPLAELILKQKRTSFPQSDIVQKKKPTKANASKKQLKLADWEILYYIK